MYTLYIISNSHRPFIYDGIMQSYVRNTTGMKNAQVKI